MWTEKIVFILFLCLSLSLPCLIVKNCVSFPYHFP